MPCVFVFMCEHLSGACGLFHLFLLLFLRIVLLSCHLITNWWIKTLLTFHHLLM